MRIVVLTVFLTVLVVGALLYSWSHSQRRRPAAVDVGPPPPEPAPTEESFTIRVPCRARLSDGKFPVSGRLAIFVPEGSQYSTWRQFPRAILFRLISSPTGASRDFPDRTLSISDTRETYEDYARRPSNRIVACDFNMDLMETYPEELTAPGRYELDASYRGLKTKPVAFVLEQ
jgi:hypothetical protein